MEFKLTINDGAKSYKQVVKEPEAMAFIGLKVGKTIEGSKIGFDGYEFLINGGSDFTGLPMHKGIGGSDRSKMLKRLKNGSAIRRTVMGNTINDAISQINLKIVKKGSKPIEEYFKTKEEKKE